MMQDLLEMAVELRQVLHDDLILQKVISPDYVSLFLKFVWLGDTLGKKWRHLLSNQIKSNQTIL